MSRLWRNGYEIIYSQKAEIIGCTFHFSPLMIYQRWAILDAFNLLKYTPLYQS